jgi:hypothetical protein
MKTLDLNACSVSEMNSTEMQKTNGGGFWDWVIGAVLGAVACQDVDSLVDSAKEGYDSIQTASAVALR